MKLITWNVNGIRSVHGKGFLPWLESQNADVVCLQETKANSDQLSEDVIHPKGYSSYWHSAQKKGYSGVAIYSKREPLDVHYGFGVETIDSEGRVIVAEYPGFTLVNTYFPNSQREHARLEYKLFFCAQLHAFLDQQKRAGKNIVLCGDFNIAHREIDLRNPKQNQKNAGFLPEECAWMESFLTAGYADTFRHFEKGPDHYTWWSYRPTIRERNIGWRLDYFVSSDSLVDRLQSARHQNDVRGSDHCPVELVLKK